MTQLEQALRAGRPCFPSGGPVGTSDGVVPTTRPRAGLARSPVRLAAGFAAAAVTVLTVQSGALAALYAVGAPVPPPWSMEPVPPLGVPQTLSAAFWGGLWGAAYALLEPWLTARLGRWWRGGLTFGALPLLAYWFVALPLKGLPVGGGFALVGVMVSIALHATFGLATAAFFRAGLSLAGRRAVP